MTTKATDKLPEIDWERGNLVDSVDHSIYYTALGESEDGREWGGTWHECCGEFEEISDIEEATLTEPQKQAV